MSNLLALVARDTTRKFRLNGCKRASNTANAASRRVRSDGTMWSSNTSLPGALAACARTPNWLIVLSRSDSARLVSADWEYIVITSDGEQFD